LFWIIGEEFGLVWSTCSGAVVVFVQTCLMLREKKGWRKVFFMKLYAHIKNIYNFDNVLITRVHRVALELHSWVGIGVDRETTRAWRSFVTYKNSAYVISFEG
jgi:hypothetical protein